MFERDRDNGVGAVVAGTCPNNPALFNDCGVDRDLTVAGLEEEFGTVGVAELGMTAMLLDRRLGASLGFGSCRATFCSCDCDGGLYSAIIVSSVCLIPSRPFRRSWEGVVWVL